MIKRVLSTLLAVVLFLSTFSIVAYASVPSQDEIDASNYLTAYGASLYSDGTTGKLKLWHETYAKSIMNTVGISKIVVRKSNGTIVKTIWGSTANGLLASNRSSYFGTYTISNLTSGTTYYCVVTVIASDFSGGDTRTVTTTAVTCP